MPVSDRLNSYHRSILIPLLLIGALLFSVPLQAEEKEGLIAEVYRFQKAEFLPDFSRYTPNDIRVSSKIFFNNLDDWPARKHIAIRWRGTLQVEKSGTYRFFLNSDDTSRLLINGEQVVDNTGDQASGQTELNAGKHDIVIEYVQSDGAAKLMVSWKPPGGYKEVLPASVLSHDSELKNMDTQPFRGERSVSIRRGPYLSLTTKMPRPEENWVHKAKAIKLDRTHLNKEQRKGTVVFDTDLLRFAGGWTGAFMKLVGVEFGMQHGIQPKPGATPSFVTPRLPGWSLNGSFSDPRDLPHGPVPASIGEYRGLYLHGKNVVLSYRVGDCEILDLPSLETRESAQFQQSVFVRTLRLGSTREDLTHLIAQGRGSGTTLDGSVPMARISSGDQQLFAALIGDTKGLSLSVQSKEAWTVQLNRLLLEVAPSSDARNVKLLLWNGKKDELETFQSFVNSSSDPIKLQSRTEGGPPRWSETMTTSGTTGDETNGYAVDTLTVPHDNPYHARMRIGGFDFFPDGDTAALCTWNGEVWTVSGIDEDLDKLTWKRVATGLHQTLGLKIIDGTIYTLGRDQITRLHDLNGDGEYDFYESFNNDVQVTKNFHEFAFSLQTDQNGNFYFSKAGPVPNGGRGFEKIVPHHGSVLKVTPDGENLEIVASGLRAPNGIAIGPDGQITAGGQQGTYVPTTCIHYFNEDRRYGTVPPTANRTPKPDTYTDPLIWLPYKVDNSAGGQVWVDQNNREWGPFRNQMLHLSYGKSKLFLVMQDPDVIQAAVARFPLEFQSGIMRGRFHPGTNQLFVAGLKGWQTNATRPGAFQRVRYTGTKTYMPEQVDVTKNGLKVQFTCKLDPDSAASARNYLMEMWNVKWSSDYGSPEFKVLKPDQKGRDSIRVTEAKLLEDNRTVKLKIPKLQRCTNYKLRFRLKAEDGTKIETSPVYGTVNQLK